MVYFDLSSEKNASHSSPSTYQAGVADRVFSFLLDYLLFSPVLSFFLFVFCNKEIMSWKASSFSAETFPLFILLSVLYVMGFSLLQSYFIYRWDATPGQYFLKLKIDIDRQEGLLFFRILLRQVSFFGSLLFLGLPWLAVLAHPRQQAFYDRLADSRVVSLKKNATFFTFEFEKRYWQALMGTVAVFAFFLTGALFWQFKNQIRNSSYSFQSLKKRGHFCEQLKNVSMKERLQTAVALNLIGQVDDGCLDAEADFVLWKSLDSEQKSLAYYAKSLTQKSTAIEDKYLTQACLQGAKHFGCKVASAFQNEELDVLYTNLLVKAERNFLQSTLQYELSLILNKSQDQESHFSELKKYDSLKVVKRYLLSEILDRAGIEAGVENQRTPASQSSRKSEFDLTYAQDLLQQMDEGL